MDPATIAIVGTAVAGAAGQWLSSEEGRKADKKERQRIAALIDKVKSPQFDGSTLTPEDFKLVGTYIPEVAPYVAEANPTVIKADSEGSRAGRAAQMAALERFKQLGQSGDDTQSRLLRAQALRDAQVQNQGQQSAIQQNFAQRGLGGSGLELVSSLLAQQGANRSAAESSERAAMEAYNRKLDALRTGAQLGGDIRGQDIALESKNADIINDYNRRFADARNSYNRYASDTRNEGQRLNLGAAQDLANRNTAQSNEFLTRNQDNYNNIQGKTYDAALGKIALQTGQYDRNSAAIRQGVQDRNSLIGGLQNSVYQGMSYYNGNQRDEKNDEFRERELKAKYG